MNEGAGLTDIELAFLMSLGLSLACWSAYFWIIEYWDRHD